jgi:hypothetical protein
MSTVVKELNIRNKKYLYEDCNPYQKIIYQQLAIQIDELKNLQTVKDNSAPPADINKKIYKAIGVLEYFESRYEAFATVSTPKNIYS